MIMRINLANFYFPFILFFYTSTALAQDPRVPLYNDLPLIINPANTGNFNGNVRVGSFYNTSKNGAFKKAFYGSLINDIYNISVDQRFGKNKDWAVGSNYMSTSGNNFVISGSYFGLYASKNFQLNNNKEKNQNKNNDNNVDLFEDINQLISKKHNLRVGLNFSYCRGIVDENKGGYSVLLDVGGFKYNPSDNRINYTINTTDYFNMSFGLLYQLTLQDLEFETGIAFNNLLKPNYAIMNDAQVRKRIRLSTNMSLAFKLNEKNKLKIENLIWKEGLYFNGPKLPADSADISDMIYGVSWLNHNKLPFLTGIYMRTSKSIFLISGVRISPSLTGKLSYELSTNSEYYPVNQFGLSVNFIFNDDKKKNSIINSRFF